MSDDYDIEEALKRYDAGPGDGTKKSVMNRFEQTANHAPVRFWKHPVPFYQAAAALLIVVALSFAAGKQSSRDAASPLLSPTASEQPTAAGANEQPRAASVDAIEWVAAESDYL